MRKNVIKNNITGGTTAPASAAKGPRFGVGSAQQRGGIQGNQPVTKVPKAAKQPAAPVPKPQTPMPWDVQASNDEAGALRKYQDKTAGLASNWLRAEQNFGLEGPWADFKTNPYSQAALLQRQYENAQRGSVNSYAAGGHLYSGALQRAREGNTFSFDKSRNDLANQRAEAYARYVGEGLGAGDEFNEARNEAQWNRINAGLKEEPDATAVPKRKRKKKHR